MLRQTEHVARGSLRTDRGTTIAPTTPASSATDRLPHATPVGKIDVWAGHVSGDAPSRFGGWVLFPSEPVSEVVVGVDGHWLGPARLGLARPDVAFGGSLRPPEDRFESTSPAAVAELRARLESRTDGERPTPRQ